ncbi:MAG: hypothetical protein NTZ74_03075, partial [Chloroflexi bacterium]|nr:hypothetical protein [Chloroflexota bacterium]
ISTPFYVLHNMQYNYITKKTEKQVLFCCQGRFIDLSDYSKIDAFILFCPLYHQHQNIHLSYTETKMRSSPWMEIDEY